ncbi:MAG: hypothetical protein U0167_00545 [bacterium]
MRTGVAAFRLVGSLPIGLPATAVVAAALLAAAPCGARTWFVNTSGTGDAPTIQAAADSASPGDTVLVAPGTYPERVQLTSAVTLRGSGSASATTIDGGNQIGYCVQSPWLDGVLLESLRFVGVTGDGYGYGGYAVTTSGRATIRDCIFENAGVGAVNACGDLTLRDSTLRQSDDIFFSGTNLTVAHCLFENSYSSYPALVEITSLGCPGPTTAVISGNTFRNNASTSTAMIGYDHVSASLDLEVSGNLFVGNGGPAVAVTPLGVPGPRQGRGGGSVSLEIRENTIARNAGYTIGWPLYPFGLFGSESIAIRRNAITGNAHGPYFGYPVSPLTIECNDVWANGVNWAGIADPTGTNGNISLEPRYCDAAQGNFTVATNSPLRDANNPCHVLIGAFGVGCGPVSVEPATWGKIKAAYRGDGVAR